MWCKLLSKIDSSYFQLQQKVDLNPDFPRMKQTSRENSLPAGVGLPEFKSDKLVHFYATFTSISLDLAFSAL